MIVATLHAFALESSEGIESLSSTSPQHAIGLAIEIATMDDVPFRRFALLRDGKPFARIITTSTGVRLDFVDA